LKLENFELLRRRLRHELGERELCDLFSAFKKFKRADFLSASQSRVEASEQNNRRAETDIQNNPGGMGDRA
jgi:hypothetical protein